MQPDIDNRCFDVVLPEKNEQEFIDMALDLGYSELIFLSNDTKYQFKSTAIKIKIAYLLKDPSEINKARKKFDYIFAPAERKFFEANVDYIIGSELSDRKDSLHYRSTCLNHVHAKLAKENNSSIVFSFDVLLNSCFRNRQIYLGRQLQNARIVRKYKVKRNVFSLARKPVDMKSRTILDALQDFLGI